MPNPTIGIIEVTVKLRLESNVTEDAARELVEDMSYEFNHPLIKDTEIIGDDIQKRIDDEQAFLDWKESTGKY